MILIVHQPSLQSLHLSRRAPGSCSLSRLVFVRPSFAVVIPLGCCNRDSFSSAGVWKGNLFFQDLLKGDRSMHGIGPDVETELGCGVKRVVVSTSGFIWIWDLPCSHEHVREDGGEAVGWVRGCRADLAVRPRREDERMRHLPGKGDPTVC